MAKEKISACPCGSGAMFEACCGRFIVGSDKPAAADLLMRSRYSAYVLRDANYLAATWHPSTRPASLPLDETPQPQWLGLQVLRHEMQDDVHAIVEFIARYKINGRACKMHETSRFVQEGGFWFYIDGDIKA